MTGRVLSERRGRSLVLTLNRPEQLNALSHDMYAALADGFDIASQDGEIRAVVITGAGAAFTAGNDLGDFSRPMPAGKPPVVRFLETLRDFEKPVVAAVNGPAVGIGVTMLLHCDVVFASDAATFRAPFAHVGLVPEAGSSLLLPRALGMAMANDMLLAGRTLSASEALSGGLISRIASPAELLSLTMHVAADVAAQAPGAMKASKALIRAGREAVAEQMAREGAIFAQQLRSAEFREAVSAFLEKRPPNF